MAARLPARGPRLLGYSRTRPPRAPAWPLTPLLGEGLSRQALALTLRTCRGPGAGPPSPVRSPELLAPWPGKAAPQGGSWSDWPASVRGIRSRTPWRTPDGVGRGRACSPPPRGLDAQPRTLLFARCPLTPLAASTSGGAGPGAGLLVKGLREGKGSSVMGGPGCGPGGAGQPRGRGESGGAHWRPSQARAGPGGPFWGHGPFPPCGAPKPGSRNKRSRAALGPVPTHTALGAGRSRADPPQGRTGTGLVDSRGRVRGRCEPSSPQPAASWASRLYLRAFALAASCPQGLLEPGPSRRAGHLVPAGPPARHP